MGWLKDIGKGISKGWSDFTGASAAKSAAGAQVDAAQMGIDEQRRQFDAMQKVLDPYVQAGTGALEQQQALSGSLGQGAQQQAIAAIQGGAGFQSALQQGETSILQNAAATGGLRGGNTQGALAQFSPQLLQQHIDQRYNQLGGLTQMGQASAAGVGAGAMKTGAGIAQSMGQMGQAQSAGILGQYNAQRQGLQDVFGAGLKIAGLF